VNSATILCIETSQSVTSVSVSHSGICSCLKEVQVANQAADKLHVLIEELLSEAALTFNDIHAVAVSSGPGSYTGLRIAAAAAKGYCFTLDIPLIAIPTFEVMVEGMRMRYKQTDTDVYVPMIDARRMEVFTGFYDKAGTLIRPFSEFILDEQAKDFFESDRRYLFFGTGAPKAYDFLKLDNTRLFDAYIPSAADLCRLAYSRYTAESFEDLAYFEPDYAKPFYSTAAKQNPKQDVL